MDMPDFDNELWICNNCEENFTVEVGSYELEKDEWPPCPACDSGNTEMR